MIEMPVVREIPLRHIVDELLDAGLLIAGGFPLYLMGGAETYTDIDAYCTDWRQFYDIYGNWRDFYVERTPNAITYRIDGELVQVVQPWVLQQTLEDLLNTTDMSASACGLLRSAGEYSVLVKYPEDIEHRVCRVLDEHEWTWYRKKQYEMKGFTVIQNFDKL